MRTILLSIICMPETEMENAEYYISSSTTWATTNLPERRKRGSTSTRTASTSSTNPASRCNSTVIANTSSSRRPRIWSSPIETKTNNTDETDDGFYDKRAASDYRHLRPAERSWGIITLIIVKYTINRLHKSTVLCTFRSILCNLFGCMHKK